MEMNFGEKLRSLRKEKNISQEKLAQYLNVSFQAVSKWETAATFPDISLLPDIANELNRALECAQKSVSVEAHDLSRPLVRNWHVEAAPSDRKQVVRFLRNKLSQACFDGCREAEWFAALQGQAEALANA